MNERDTHLLPASQLRMDKLLEEEAGALSHGGQHPDDKDDLQLVVERQPGMRISVVTCFV